jgi:hypothetical protein
MNFVEEPSRKTPILRKTDILVLGGGPAGLSAALAAAREGVDTMIVERYGCLGGVITQSMIGTIAWYRYANTVDAGGIGAEFERRAKEMKGSINVFGNIRNKEMIATLEQDGLMVNGKPTYEILDTEVFKYLADELIQEAEITPLLHCTAVDTIMEGETIKGVITESKSGRQAILARRIIDATGDADIAYFSGAPFRKNPKNDLMEVTVNFGASGINIGKFLMYIYLNPGSIGDWGETSGKEESSFSTYLVEPFNKAKKAGEIPDDVNIESFWTNYTDAGEITSFNGIHMN